MFPNMNIGKSDVLCKFCQTQKAIYTCPKCCSKYCSSNCFKHAKHVQCSEIFFQEWVTSSLQSVYADESERNRMLEILKKSAEVQEGEVDEEEGEVDEEEGEADELSCAERFGDLDLSEDSDEHLLWERLTDNEKAEFELLLKEQKIGDVILVKHPWWIVSEVSLVEELNTSSEKENDCRVVRPNFPVEIPKLSTLTSVPPSDCVKYNVINVIYSYAFLMRMYNCDLWDLIEDVIEIMFYLSPVLSKKYAYSSLEESIQDTIRLVMNSKFDVPLAGVKSVVQDVCCIINGPGNAQSNCYLLCCLSDIRMLICEYQKLSNTVDISSTKKKFNKTTLMSIRKIEYLISWSVEFYMCFKGVVPVLKTMFMSENIDDFCSTIDQNVINEAGLLDCNTNIPTKKPLIQEID